MQVSKINTGLSFGRALHTDEMNDFTNTLKEGKKTLGQTGNSILIIPTSSLPQTAETNTGMGHLTSKSGIDYIDYMKNYLDFNVVEDLPQGQIKKANDFYCNYESSGLALGNQNINPEILKNEKLLTEEEFSEIVKANNTDTKDTLMNWENVTENNKAQDNALKKAHERFNKLDDKSELKQKYNKFIQENEAWLNFTRENEPDQEFFKFKQFLASEHLAAGKKNLNDRGIKLCGDIAINFSDDEVKAFPNAFKKDHYIGVPGWKIPSLDYDTILDEASDSNKLLKMKVQQAAKRYDMLRFDAAWNYVTPIITPKGEDKILDSNRKPMQSQLLDLMEKWVKDVKGDDFDIRKNLIYEFEAGVEEFSPYWDKQLIPAVKDRIKIYQNTYMSEDWGSNDAFLKRGWSPDEFSIGTNQDVQPMRQIAEGAADSLNGNAVHKNNAINPLARILKLDAEALQNPSEFFKAKFADMMMAKNNHFFFMDIDGQQQRFNEHCCQSNSPSVTNFSRKVPMNYAERFHKALQEGFAFNIMDALEKAFKAKGFDESNADLYSKIVKYRDILAEKEGANATASTAQGGKVSCTTSAVSTAAEAGAKAGENAAESGAKELSKAGKSYKPLWIAAGAIAVLGGAYAIYKNRYPKPVHEEKTKVQ